MKGNKPPLKASLDFIGKSENGGWRLLFVEGFMTMIDVFVVNMMSDHYLIRLQMIKGLSAPRCVSYSYSDRDRSSICTVAYKVY